MPDVARKLEVELMGKIMKSCAEVKATDIYPEISEEQKKFYEKSKCDQLSALKMKTDDLENRILLLQGFKKLKLDIEKQKAETSAPSPVVAQEAAKKFKKNLEIASALEVLISTPSSDEESMIQALSKTTEKDSPEKLKASIEAFCKKDKSLAACSREISPEAINEIVQLIKDPVTPEKIAEWQKALSIAKKKDGTPWSFSEMYAEMNGALSKMDGKTPLSKAEISVIQSLPDFKDAKTSLAFLNDMKGAKDISLDKGEIAQHGLTSLVSEIHARQQEQVKNKVSLTWIEFNKFQDNITDADLKSKCVNAYKNYPDAASCVRGLKMMAAGIENDEERQTTLENMVESLESTLRYEEHLAGLEKLCATANSEECKSDLYLNEDKLLDELNVLKRIEAQVLKENEELKTFRNYALEALDTQGCATKLAVDVNECNNALIPKELQSLTAETIKLSLMMSAEEKVTATDITAFCKPGEQRLEFEDLCKVAKGESVNKDKQQEEKKGPKDVKYTAQTDPGSNYNPTRAALSQGLASLLGAAGSLFSNPVNPYPQYPYMNPMANRPLSISDGIISSAQMQSGYGTYSALTPSMSRYFSK